MITGNMDYDYTVKLLQSKWILKIINILAAHDLLTLGAKALAATVLTWFAWNFFNSAPQLISP